MKKKITKKKSKKNRFDRKPCFVVRFSRSFDGFESIRSPSHLVSFFLSFLFFCLTLFSLPFQGYTQIKRRWRFVFFTHALNFSPCFLLGGRRLIVGLGHFAYPLIRHSIGIRLVPIFTNFLPSFFLFSLQQLNCFFSWTSCKRERKLSGRSPQNLSLLLLVDLKFSISIFLWFFGGIFFLISLFQKRIPLFCANRNTLLRFVSFDWVRFDRNLFL